MKDTFFYFHLSVTNMHTHHVQDVVESLVSLGSIYSSNTGRARRTLRGDIERRSLALNTRLVDLFAGLHQVPSYACIIAVT